MRGLFLERIEEDPYDDETRQIYADWLEEQGEWEESERQRKWVAARKWLDHVCEEYNYNEERDGDEDEDEDEEDDSLPLSARIRNYDDEWRISYERLMELANEAASGASEDGYTAFSTGSNERMCFFLRENAEKFWECWSVVTGNPMPLGRRWFSCGC